MATRRNALGRGLGALLPEPAKKAEERAASVEAPVRPVEEPTRIGVGTLPIERVEPNPDQPRRVFDEESLESLADSIRRHGILQPVVVRATESGRYELVVGERRWRAARLAGLGEIPAVVQDVDPDALLEVALVENVQRRDLNPIELAEAFKALVESGATQEEVGRRVGLDRSTIANQLRLLELPRDLQADVENGRLTGGHAKALLAVTHPERRLHLRDRVVAEGLSVRAAEELARQLAGPKARSRKSPRATEAVDPNLQQLIDTLRDHLQTKVRITGSGNRGKVEIEFYGPEELHRITSSILEGR